MEELFKAAPTLESMAIDALGVADKLKDYAEKLDVPFGDIAKVYEAVVLNRVSENIRECSVAVYELKQALESNTLDFLRERAK